MLKFLFKRQSLNTTNYMYAYEIEDRSRLNALQEEESRSKQKLLGFSIRFTLTLCWHRWRKNAHIMTCRGRISKHTLRFFSSVSRIREIHSYAYEVSSMHLVLNNVLQFSHKNFFSIAASSVAFFSLLTHSTRVCVDYWWGLMKVRTGMCALTHFLLPHSDFPLPVVVHY